MSDYFEFTHSLSSIQKWFGKRALIRTLGSAGLIPITNKGIVYDITEQSGVLEWAQDIGGPFQQRQTLHLDDSSFEFEKSVFTFGNGEPKLSLHRQEKKAISYTFKGSFDEFVGSDRADIIYGNNDWNIIKSEGGDDYIEGKGGNDSLWGGTGFNLLKGGQGIDSVNFQLSEGAHQQLGAPDRQGNYEFNGFKVVTTQEGLEDHGFSLMGSDQRVIGIETADGKVTFITDDVEKIKLEPTAGSRWYEQSFNQVWNSFLKPVRDPEQNSIREFTLMGTSSAEAFYGGRGRDNIIGAEGNDEFHLNIFEESASYGANQDRIFDLSREDKIIIHSSLLDINPEDAGLVIVSNDEQRSAAMRDENVHFAYDTRSGDIFWDSNGANDGGDKALAKLVGDSEFSGTSQIEFI